MTSSAIKKYEYVVRPEDRPALVELYKSGATLEEVGSRFGVTRERARQLIVEAGVSASEGGATIRSLLRAEDKKSLARSKNERDEARIRARWGMSLDDYKAHVAEFGKASKRGAPMQRYIEQRRNARMRGIEWNFTFVTWWRIWLDSGKWSERARGKGYVMARYGDGKVAYSPENVYICTGAQNSSDSYIVSPASERFRGAKSSVFGKGVGYTFVSRNKKNPYMAQSSGKYLGSFPTAELARAAYLSAVEKSKKDRSNP